MISCFHIKRKRNCRDSYSNLYLNYAEETDKMIIATKQLFYAMEVHKLLHFTNPDMSAVSFAMTIHGLMDYELDQSNGKCSYETDKNLLNDYLKWFCEENAV